MFTSITCLTCYVHCTFLVNSTFVLTELLAHYLRSCCRHPIRLVGLLVVSYAGGWVWPKTATCCIISAASFYKCICIYIFKVCNNMCLAFLAFKFTNLNNVL